MKDEVAAAQDWDSNTVVFSTEGTDIPYHRLTFNSQACGQCRLYMPSRLITCGQSMGHVSGYYGIKPVGSICGSPSLGISKYSVSNSHQAEVAIVLIDVHLGSSGST